MLDSFAALKRLREALAPLPEELHTEVDELGDVLVYVRRDMLHLDADALHDRLHHFSVGELDRRVPMASAHLSFRHAKPAEPDAASTMDLQEGWLAVEAMLRMEARGAGEKDVDELARVVPRFLQLVEGSGRPAGWRRPDVGTLE